MLALPAFTLERDGKQPEKPRPLRWSINVSDNNLLPAPILPRRGRIQKLQLVWSSPKFFEPGGIRILLDKWPGRHGLRSNARARGELLSRYSAGCNKKTSRNSD